jgi:hypothetical protein
VELLVALALTLVVAGAALSLWAGLERTGSGDADRMVLLTQSRVAVARLERDLRLGTAQGCPFAVAGPVLEAKAAQVVLLTRSGETGALALVEWEVVGGSLMRRRGSCPLVRPVSVPHSLFTDNKTMLEGLNSGACFHYFVSGVEVPTPVPAAELPFVDEVRLAGRATVAESTPAVRVAGGCRVGR